jgi:hypothetical protein
MGRGTQFNGVARLEARFADELRGQFQRGDVACVHIDAGEVDDARGGLIAHGRPAGAEPGADGRAGLADGDEPLGAVHLGHGFVAVVIVLDDVLRAEAEVKGLLVPAEVEVGDGEFGNGFDEAALAVRSPGHGWLWDYSWSSVASPLN